MSNLQKWGKVVAAYQATGRSKILKGLYLKRPLSKSWPYYAAVIIYLLTSIEVYRLSMTFYPSILIIIVVAYGIYAWLETRIKEEYKEVYEKYDLDKQPFFSRTKHLSYILFSTRISNQSVLSKQDASILVEWENIRAKKLAIPAFYESPIYLIPATFISGLVLQYMEWMHLISKRYILLIVFFVLLILWFNWTISGLLNVTNKTNMEICRFLEWWAIDK